MDPINEIEIDDIVYDIESKKLSNSRKISVIGDASGSVDFDGSKDVSIDLSIDVNYEDISFDTNEIITQGGN